LATIRKQSTILILIVVTLIVLLSSGGLYTMYVTHTIKTDASIVNKLGIIRGSIQRLSRWELTGQYDNELIDDINSRINEFRNHKITVHDNNNQIINALDELNNTWILLEESIYIYREDPSPEHQLAVQTLSEDAWIKSNFLVLESQLVSQDKIRKYNNSFKLFGINLILGTILIFLIKKYVQDTLEVLVNYDGLTKIHNRLYFNDYLNKEINSSSRYNRNLSLIFFDIDFFKRINDKYGHDVGDVVLKELSCLIKNNIRKSDLFARIGGEEFAIIASETTLEQALILTEKLRKLVEEHSFNNSLNITISLGVTQFLIGDNSKTLFKRADNALYLAKRNGRNKTEAVTTETT